ncbi:type II toxin-antitoxin system VapC family toxin [Variovorax sp. RHLX14]|uniref:type II toxin-antitoxin system VapC family toxin n=1 Tax=Variovorax sp. RHLX14 TaxID=1259731 RepID=UPI003F450DB0
MPISRKRPVASDTAALVLDSSCWLEFFMDTPRADAFANPILAPEALIVPVLTIYEVFKKMSREVGQEVASYAVGLMRRGQVIDIDLQLCLDAAGNGLPFADSLIYATAQSRSAILWTQDAHFDGLPGVKYFPKS